MSGEVKELVAWCTERAKKCPSLKEEIQDFLDLAISEIEEGGSMYHEISLCMADVEELIKENCN
jgi:hypothetical protein